MLSLYFLVDGGWGDWGPWSFNCLTNCLQEKRMRRRTRTCTNSVPQEDGFDCEGENTDWQICGKNHIYLLSCCSLFLILQNYGKNLSDILPVRKC